VIDLDTVMPGYFLSDLGDMFRSYLPTNTEEESSRNNSDANAIIIGVHLDYFQAIVQGYLEEMFTSLTSHELDYLVYAGEMMIYMQCIRFLTDYLHHDEYFKTTYAQHNYDRAYNQYQLLCAYRNRRPDMQLIVKQIVNSFVPHIKQEVVDN